MMKFLSGLLFMIVFASCNEVQNTGNGGTSLQHLPSPADTASALPHLFTDKNGAVYLSWIQKTNNGTIFKYAVLNNGSWTKPAVIASGNDWFVNWADYPMMAADGQDHVLAHFLQKSAAGKFTYDIKMTRSADQGRSWSEPKILHDDGTKSEHGFVSITPYGDAYFVSWLDGRQTVNEDAGAAADHTGEHHGVMTLRGAVVDKQGAKSAEWQLDDRVCDCCQTTAAVTANGPVVIYRDRSEEEVRDISIVRLVNGKWTDPKSIHPDGWKIDGCPVNGPRSDAMGNHLVVAWFTSASEPSVKLAFSEDGGAGFQPPITINENKTIGRVDVVLLNEQSAMVSWMEGAAIKAMKVYKDGRKETPVFIGTSSEARSSGFPQMTRSGNHLIFAWTDDREKTIKVGQLVIKS